MDDIYLDVGDISRIIRKLEKLGDEAIADVTRETINDVAYDMKGNRSRPGTMIKQARKGFKHSRNKTFIPSMTGARFARGKDINKLKAIAGVVEKPNKDKAAKGLSEQNFGDPIDHTFAPLPEARIGKSEARRIKTKARHNKRQDVDLTKVSKANKMKLMMMAKKTNRTILVNGKKGRKFVGVPGKVIKNSNGNTRMRLKWLYAENPNKQAKIKKATPFVYKGAENSIRKAPKYFNKHFKRAIRKYSRK